MSKPAKYVNSKGESPLPGSASTGWANSDAIIQRPCPKCNSPAGYHCTRPSGGKAWPPHAERIVYGPEHDISRALLTDPAG